MSKRTSRSIGGIEVAVSNPDKVLFPGPRITKGELVDYYQDHAEHILRHAMDRPVTLKRFPDGLDGEAWFQKHAPAGLPSWVTTAGIVRSEGRPPVQHIVLDQPATLVYLANLAAIELHVGMAGVEDVDHPTELVLDLDPSPGASIELVRRATRWSRQVLEELGMPTRLKSSGSRGFHVHGLLDGGGDQELVRDIARGAATILAHRHPVELTVEFRKDRRGSKVFVDWMRNSPKQTAIAPYSVRAREDAPVATPMAWDELPGTDPQRWNLRSVRRRLAQREDPWEPVAGASVRQVATSLRQMLQELGDRSA